MSPAEQLLQTLHHFGHALIPDGDTRLLSFADACDDDLPRWLSREIDAHVVELLELCKAVPCARCARPGLVPLAGLMCADCDREGPLGRVPRGLDAHA
jgi:hypothetical protein